MRPANLPPVPALLPADPAGHLPLPLLRQYVAGALPVAEQHRIEAHTITCARCADVLDGLAQTDAATTDAALATLRTRLHQRIALEEGTADRGGLAWRGVAAMLLLLVLSTAAWLGLRQPEGAAPARPELAATTPVASPVTVPEPNPAASRAVAESLEKPVVVAIEPARAERPARPRLARRAAPRRPAFAAAQPAAAVVAEESRPGQPSAFVVPDLAALPLEMPADSVVAPAAVTLAKAKAEVRSEGAARKANLPAPLIIRPQPIGGYPALRDYLHRENTFNPVAPNVPLEGSVRLKFTVTASGHLENIRVVKGMRADYNAEAIRLICEGPAWQPGAANGRRADLIVEMLVPF